MKILLTGATGFLGAHMMRALIANKHMVIGLKRRSSHISRLFDLKEAVIFFDIEDGLDHLFAKYADVDLIIHVATSYGNHGEPLSEILTTNVVLPLRMMELALRYKNCRFLNTDTFFCKAEDGYEYLAGYIFSKKLFYQLGTQFAEKNKCSFVNLRLEHVYGPGDSPEKFTSNIINKMLNNEPEIKLTRGEQVRDFVYVDDVVDAYMAVINSSKTLAKTGVSCFEVGSGQAISIKDFITAAHQMIGSKSSLSFGALPYRENEIMYSKANLESLWGLGWESKVDLKAGLKKVILSLQQVKN